MATSQTPGNRPSSTSQSPEEDDQTGPGATRRFTEEESRVIQLLERISNNQERILSFLSERANPEYGLHQTAQSLWDSPHHAWSTSVRESEAPKDNSLGSAFFNSIAPCGTSFIESFPPSSGVKLQNLSLARNEFENWIKRSRSERWIEAHFRTYDAARTISNVGQWWPSMWKVSRLWNRPCCSSQEVSYAFPDSFQNPLHCTTVSHGAIEVRRRSARFFS